MSKSMQSDFMKLAIQEAYKSAQDFKCGVVIVRDGQIVSSTYNRQRELYDASAHAEILAIRDAGKKLQDKSLKNCTMYCTCEPCVMCLAAICYTKISDIYVGVKLADVMAQDNLIAIHTDTFLEACYRPINIHWGVAEDEVRKFLYAK